MFGVVVVVRFLNRGTLKKDSMILIDVIDNLKILVYKLYEMRDDLWHII